MTVIRWGDTLIFDPALKPLLPKQTMEGLRHMKALSPHVRERRTGSAHCVEISSRTKLPCGGIVRYQCNNEACLALLCGTHVVRSPAVSLKCPRCGLPVCAFARRSKFAGDAR